jgi:hypothetical protein
MRYLRARILARVLIPNVILGENRSDRCLEDGRRSQPIVGASKEHERRGFAYR